MAASYISVPRDLTKVKSKVMFNLTKRQLICFGMAVLIGVPSFFLMKTVMKTNTAVMGMMVIMMPFFFHLFIFRNVTSSSKSISPTAAARSSSE
jgi:hypothetical protein